VKGRVLRWVIVMVYLRVVVMVVKGVMVLVNRTVGARARGSGRVAGQS